MNPRAFCLLLAGSSTLACATGGTAWMAQPLSTGAWAADEAPPTGPVPDLDQNGTQSAPPLRSHVLGEPVTNPPSSAPSPAQPASANKPGVSSSATPGDGHVLGTFRNTYYDLPAEADFSGATVALKNGQCKTIKTVARSFYEAVCVQGSGTLTSGHIVSFSKRDCACAALCPRTEQHICFDELSAKAYPWGRGATGRAITPLLSVAVDSELVPLDTAIYIPEYDGLPRDLAHSALHDGCFIAQDRGVRVKGEHVDVFTGQHELTTLWNSLVPSNRGVTIVLDSPRCARASASVSSR